MADRALPEPLRVDRGHGQLHLPPAARLRGDAREDIVTERGYPQLTDQAKRKILGGNLARLHGIDPEAKAKELGVPSGA